MDQPMDYMGQCFACGQMYENGALQWHKARSETHWIRCCKHCVRFAWRDATRLEKEEGWLPAELYRRNQQLLKAVFIAELHRMHQQILKTRDEGALHQQLLRTRK